MKFDLEDGMAVLARTPSTLRALLEGLPAVWVEGDEGPETWSAFDIVGHLLHGERTDWIARTRILLEHGAGRPFEPFDRFAQLETSKGKTIGELLEEFAALRLRNLETLREMNLTAEDLDKEGMHPALGVVTLRELLATWVVHDLGHLAQISRAMAKQYGDNVGPWAEYLAILAEQSS
jgi:uncharacterized damage-inducible protein DinB